MNIYEVKVINWVKAYIVIAGSAHAAELLWQKEASPDEDYIIESIILLHKDVIVPPYVEDEKP
jgi:hypothetical protein